LNELSIKAITSVRGLFTAAFRSFFQLINQIELVGEQYIKTLNYVIIPITIFHSLVAILLSLVVSFGFVDSTNDIIGLYLVLMPASIGISVVSPLYHVLIGVGDTNYILMLHLRLALVSTFFSVVLIPFIGLWGAGIGMTIATLYNAVAVFKRFESRIGFPKSVKILAFRQKLKIGFGFLCGACGAVSMIVATDSPYFLLHTLWMVFLIILGWMLAREPLIVKALSLRKLPA
jgi:O-antigen/teichoic acid export membrane protein